MSERRRCYGVARPVFGVIYYTHLPARDFKWAVTNICGHFTPSETYYLGRRRYAGRTIDRVDRGR